MVRRRTTPAQRAKQVGDQIQRELADILRQLRDPRLPPLTVMTVELSRDLSLAKVYVTQTALEQIDGAEVEAALQRASGHIRTALGQRLSIYSTPKLQFVYDASVERGIRLSQLIDEAVAQRAFDDDDA